MLAQTIWSSPLPAGRHHRVPRRPVLPDPAPEARPRSRGVECLSGDASGIWRRRRRSPTGRGAPGAPRRRPRSWRADVRGAHGPERLREVHAAPGPRGAPRARGRIGLGRGASTSRAPRRASARAPSATCRRASRSDLPFLVRELVVMGLYPLQGRFPFDRAEDLAQRGGGARVRGRRRVRRTGGSQRALGRRAAARRAGARARARTRGCSCSTSPRRTSTRATRSRPTG